MADQLVRRQFLRRITGGAVGLGLTSTQAFAAREEWKAGLAEVSITPGKSMWMGGYANRTKPSEGVALELHAKALALEDQTGARSVMVTTDLLGLPAAVSHVIAERAKKQYDLTRDRLLLSSSHTHSGPVLQGMLDIMYPLSEQQKADIKSYTSELEDKIVDLIGQSLKSLHPARLSLGHAEAGFGVNRRVKTPSGDFIGGVNKEGPVDHDVPILRVDDKHGRLRGLVFGYACHNTAAKAWMKFNGDYAGFAEGQLENQHHGTFALFVAGCAGDANPNPRGTLDHARVHGEELAAAVEKSLSQPFQPVAGPLKTAYEEFPVNFVSPSRYELQAKLSGKDVYAQKWAELMLKYLDRDGHLPTEYSYPLAVWQFGKDLTLIAMAGEVVVDYDLRLKKEFGAEKLWVAAYCNDVFAYIPSLRVLKEGGYEGGGSMVYYGHPGPFTPTIEETIIGKVHELVGKVRS